MSDDPSAAIEETDTVPENAVKVHEADIKDVTKFGTYTTDSFTLTDTGTYAWHWVMTPSLTGDQNHNPLTALAWRQLTHGKVQHAFGLASEIVRVQGKKPNVPKCEVSTKSQGEVTFENGKADLHDELLLKNCSDAAKAEFELWKQSNGDQSGDVLVTVTGTVDAVDGAHSPTVTVHETGTYYWREKVYDQTGKLISYGDARKRTRLCSSRRRVSPPLVSAPRCSCGPGSSPELVSLSLWLVRGSVSACKTVTLIG
mgnify:FL=1